MKRCALNAVSALILAVCSMDALNTIAWATAPDLSIEELSLKEAPRPFRAGIFRLGPALDQEKTLGLSDGVGWATASGKLIIGSPDRNSIAAFDTDTQQPRWWNPVSAPPTAQITVFGDHLIMGLRNGSIQKWEVATGKRVWEASLDTFTERQTVLSGNILLILTSTQMLYALDFQSGKTLWLYDAGFPDGMTVRPGAAPIVYENEVIFGTAAGEVLGINLQAGKVLWRHNPSYKESRFHDVVGQLVVKDGRLLVTRYDGHVAAIDLSASSKQDFKSIWADDLPSITASTFRDGRLYVGCINGDVVAYDASSGRRIWRSTTGQSVASITALESSVIIGGTDGRVTAIGAQSGEPTWHDDINAEISTAPVLVNEHLFFATSLRNLYGYKIR